jgi:hypothetical protein
VSSPLELHGFSDVDFAGSRLDRKSTSGTCEFLGSSCLGLPANNRVLLNPLLRQSMLPQLVVALSSVDGVFWYTKHVCYTLVWISLWN